MVVHLYKGIFLSSKKEWTLREIMNFIRYLDKPQMHYAKSKKPDSEDCTVYDSIANLKLYGRNKSVFITGWRWREGLTTKGINTVLGGNGIVQCIDCSGGCMAICLKTFTTVPMKHDLLYVN